MLGGILEIVERDALANMWLLRRTPQRIPHSTVLRHAADLLPSRSIERLAAFDVTSDIDIPTVVVVDRWPDPSLPPASRQAQFGSILSVGSACHPNATRALRKAIIEAGQGRIYVRQLQMQQEKWTAGDSNENVSDFAAHARYYTAYPELINEAFRFLIDCQEESH